MCVSTHTHTHIYIYIYIYIYILSNSLVAEAHTVEPKIVRCPGFELCPYINYTMSLPIESSSR